MSTITKKDLANQISNEANITQQQAQKVVQVLIDQITDHLSDGDTVVLRNFGTFQVSVTKPKIGRNPRNPTKAVPIPSRSVVKFKPGKEMKERVAKLPPATDKEAKDLP